MVDVKENKVTTVRSLVGKVLSSKMQKTVTVLIERRVKHSLYGKIVRRVSKVHARDDGFGVVKGDTVEIIQSIPLAKTVFWRVSKVVEKSKS